MTPSMKITQFRIDESNEIDPNAVPTEATRGERKVISKWERRYQGMTRLEQVVYKKALGKNKKGKTIYSSTTRHERCK